MYAKCLQNDSGLGRTTSQLVESLWASIMKERHLPVSTMYLHLLDHFSKWFQERKVMFASQISKQSFLGKKKESNLNQLKIEASKLKVKEIDKMKGKVQTNELSQRYFISLKLYLYCNVI
jgi:hypothetical protein